MPIIKDPERVARGKKNKAAGKAFERKVETDLESHGWIVMKFNKQIDLVQSKLVNAKPKFNPFTRGVIYSGVGFPDFICFRKNTNPEIEPIEDVFNIQFVECKSNGSLSPEEKLKCNWIQTNIAPVYIASKTQKRGEIVYTPYQ